MMKTKIITLAILAALSNTVTAAEITEFKKGDIATAEAFNNNFKAVRDDTILNSNAIEELSISTNSKLTTIEGNTTSNTTAIETLAANIEQSRSNPPLFIEDLNRLRVGEFIPAGSEDDMVMLDSLNLLASLDDIFSGRVTTSEPNYASPDCQGTAYFRSNNEIMFSVRLAENGILVGYDEATNEILIMTQNVEMTDVEIKSWSYGGNCHNHDEYNIRNEKVYTPSRQELPNMLAWQCEPENQSVDCHKSLYLGGELKAPFFINR
ncbi:hypothetical protein RI844_04905 [Thalassotalea fonticola]|uniref:Uncharacterized protein n=1 Tax=Thalassotalea fonticola TaxID=3065649 RepID=A0ABZ0GSH5_9GAMM|nr:hypothetical protein RI844_04905 [Colwelliaceae bacterium S1-1]